MWPVLTRIWFVLSDCALKQDDHEQAISYEQKILHELPQDQLPPPNHQTQLNMRVLSRRTERADIELAQELLDHMKNAEDGDKLAAVLDMMQADIFFQDGQYQAAARGYQTLISKGALNNAEQQQYIHMKLDKCKEQLGDSEFQFIVDDIEQQSQQATVH
ncbi:hypothetical protein [Gynuella sp.]|uniref:hypothetical protein n=1 Tax=Gynuella sp. TaxID=2969146 RepID=UPI003D0F23A5